MAASLSAASTSAVKVWEGTHPLPTYQEGLPDENPQFDQFSPRKINYPYTLRNNLTGKAETVVPFADPKPASKPKASAKSRSTIKQGIAS